ncbi:substrate-binding domain-containing protein [Streptomyces sp. NPDC051976]|uniref:PstS family phosphate ABC transporter substrate-binding protein n=1 Tax=Streptomyces sp. NPDC051976 TaxID=3154947 RepID=UPI003426CC87
MQDWLSPDNVIAIVGTVIGTAATLIPFVADRKPRRRRIGYRVQMDVPVDRRGSGPAAAAATGVFQLDGVEPGSLVLLRVENDGSQDIHSVDYPGPEHGLSVDFDRRRIAKFSVLFPRNARYLNRYFTEDQGFGPDPHDPSVLHLPRVELPRGKHFKLLVLLTGGEPGNAIQVSPELLDGEVHENHSATVDDLPRLFSRSAQGLLAVLLACVLGLSGYLVFGPNRTHPDFCEKGTLTVVGSTAFKPTVLTLSRTYEALCPGSKVTVDAEGSESGLSVLQQADDPGHVLAFSDGRSEDPSLTKGLTATPEGKVDFAVIAGPGVTVRDLATSRIRVLFTGGVATWSTREAAPGPGGRPLPVVLVGRKSDSGTRKVLRDTLLGGGGEAAQTSQDCRGRFPGSDRQVLRCERQSTDDVIATVRTVPGAIGYAELTTARQQKATVLAIDGQAPGGAAYPFHATEYAYAKTALPHGSIAAGFLTFLDTTASQALTSADGAAN